MIKEENEEEQCRFRPDCATLLQLHTLRQLSQGSWEFAQPGHVCFVDLEKTFDSVTRRVGG